MTDFLIRFRTQFNEQVSFLVLNMNGKNSIEDLKRKFKEKFFIELTDEHLSNFIRTLKDLNLMKKRTNFAYPETALSFMFRSDVREQLISFFKKKKVVPALFQGNMYKSNSRDLIADLRKCFASVDEKKIEFILKKINTLKGVVVPHSNMELSGVCAAWAYKAIELAGLPDILVLLVPVALSPHSYPLLHLVQAQQQAPPQVPLLFSAAQAYRVGNHNSNSIMSWARLPYSLDKELLLMIDR